VIEVESRSVVDNVMLLVELITNADCAKIEI